MTPPFPGKVCIIGAGSSGIATCKVFAAAGIPFDCFERSDRVGGNWVFGNKSGLSSAYRSLHINTSRDRMAYSDFPMPRDYPDFPHHTLIARYFEQYVDHFGFRAHITFSTSVERVEPLPQHRFAVELRSLLTDTCARREYAAVVVANGHHSFPRFPEPPFPGTFSGQVLHSHDFVDSQPFVGKRVLVLGMGNSAMDIAVECSHVAERVFLAARRGAHIVPKYLFGRPIDTYLTSPHWPMWLKAKLGVLIYRLYIGDLRRYGLPIPTHPPLAAHPTISSDIFMRLGSGDITPLPNIRSFAGQTVTFVDGSQHDVDVLIYCTGYQVRFPFFDPGFLAAPDNDLPLYYRVFHPDLPSLLFVGLLQPLGAVMPLAEAQSLLLADYLRGAYALPPRAQLDAALHQTQAALSRRYYASPRHTMQVDFDQYLYALRKEHQRGKQRARRAAYQ